MTRRCWAIAWSSFWFCSCTRAAERPDFSGEWTLSAGKSEFGSLPVPGKLVRKVDHKDPDLKITTITVSQAGERTQEFAYRTDGSESVNKSGQGEAKSVVKWQGAALAFTTRREVQGMSFEQNEKWTLSDDGKTLTAEGNLRSPQGEVALKLVLEKK